jgi:hypothetical protein
MKTNQQTQEELDKELDDLLHPERFVTRWMRIRFWFMNLDLRFFEAIGKTRRAFAKFKKNSFAKDK